MRGLPNNYRHKWDFVVAVYGANCAYCHHQPATQIDHVMPRSWRDSNHINNLRPACAWCNLHVSNLVFDTFEDKYDWLKQAREKRGSGYKNRRTVCVDCLLPYQNPLHAPNLFRCAECYDYEYNKLYHLKKGWRDWLQLLTDAGFIVDAHRGLADLVHRNRHTSISMKDKTHRLGMEYSARESWEVEGLPEWLFYID